MPEGFADEPAPATQTATASRPLDAPQTLEFAEIGRRGIAWVVDLFVISFIAAWPAAYFFPDSENMSVDELTNDARLVAIMLAIYIVYPWLMEALRGQTLGKMVVGIKVVREDGSPVGVWQSLVRSVLRVVDGLFVGIVGALLIATSRKQQRLGDRVAHTIVVRRNESSRRFPGPPF
jgi:uncharacterized RDD family membrane protein YckC